MANRKEKTQLSKLKDKSQTGKKIRFIMIQTIGHFIVKKKKKKLLPIQEN